MITKNKKNSFKTLYIFFVILSLTIFFFSTTKVQGKAFDINNIEISKPFEINFDKNKVIDEGFKKAFLELVLLTVNSSDQNKISKAKLNEIKGMIESFSIKEEKFIDEIYYVNLGVSFNKKKVFKYFLKKNIFPSMPIKKKVLFIPVIIDENNKDLLLFSNNNIYKEWNEYKESFHLLNYILPSEDIEDLNILKNKYNFIEQYDFNEIINKYSMEDSIVALVFKNEKTLRILSRIFINGNLILKNQSFSNLDMNDKVSFKLIINELKTVYEDYWKNLNQINTSIKLPLSIKVKNSDNLKVSNFEKILNNTDLIYDFYISKFDMNFIYYQIIFNGTPDNFLKSMSNNDYSFDTQNKQWILK